MASHSVKELLSSDGGALLVEIARRDSTGRNIADTLNSKANTNSPSFTGKVNFSSQGYSFNSSSKRITNMASGIIKDVYIPTGQNGQSQQQYVTIPNGSYGSGTWAINISVCGVWGISALAAIETVSSTGFSVYLVRIRNIPDNDTNYDIHWTAIKYY